MSDFIKCEQCGELFNPAYLDQVATHMHAEIEVNETIKGVKVDQTECVGCKFEHVEGTVYKCLTCGKEKDINF